jgi:hypothetical protein
MTREEGIAEITRWLVEDSPAPGSPTEPRTGSG